MHGIQGCQQWRDTRNDRDQNQDRQCPGRSFPEVDSKKIQVDAFYLIQYVASDRTKQAGIAMNRIDDVDLLCIGVLS